MKKLRNLMTLNLLLPLLSAAQYTGGQGHGYALAETTPSIMDCPFEEVDFGVPCDDGDPVTVMDAIDASCNCVGIPCTDDINLTLLTDGSGNETSWAILPVGGGPAVCSGASYPSNAEITIDCCVPAGCYRLVVYDGGDNGMAGGGYLLRTDDGRTIIDNTDAGDFGSISTIALDGAFCVPIGPDEMIESQRGKMDFLPGDLMIARANAAVAAEYGVTNATSGYQFWLFDPNGTYTRRVFMSHDSFNGMPADADRARHLNFSWLATNPVPTDLVLNMCIRGRVAGNYLPFGPACRLKVLSTPPACPTTKLVDFSASPNFSCGVVRTYGFSQKVYANPVAGADRYQFRFSNEGEGYVRLIAFNNPACILNWGNNLPLEDGVNYDVRVRVSFDGGANYCPYGDVCVVTIQNPPVADARITAAPTATLWPNPNTGDQLWLSIAELPAEVTTIAMDIHDLRGQLVMDQVIPTQGGMFQDVVDLNDGLAKGMYLVTIIAGEQRFTERLVIQ